MTDVLRGAALAACVAALLAAGTEAGSAGQAAKWTAGRISVPRKEILDSASPLQGAYYVTKTGVEMVGPSGRSLDNGRTWTPFTPTPDPNKGLPTGYRRSPLAGWVDPVNGLLLQMMLALDIATDPDVAEPDVGVTHYYLRYRVSEDKGLSYLLDEPLIQTGHTVPNPFPGVWTGKNAYYIGDVGSIPIRTRKGDILIPGQACVIGDDGKLANPGGGYTWTEAMIIIGNWKADKRIEWKTASVIKGDPARSTRGMIEPTLAELPDGRVLCVMRGSNGGEKDPGCKLPSYRWYSISDDGGYHWSRPEPMKYDTGEEFFSPSSMSQLLTHSNGRIYWIGNISDKNCQANHPRNPLCIAEVNPKTCTLVKSTLTTIDSLQPEDTEGLSLSHGLAFEDRETHEIVLPMQRNNKTYTKSKPVIYRIAVGSG